MGIVWPCYPQNVNWEPNFPTLARLYFFIFRSRAIVEDKHTWTVHHDDDPFSLVIVDIHSEKGQICSLEKGSEVFSFAIMGQPAQAHFEGERSAIMRRPAQAQCFQAVQKLDWEYSHFFFFVTRVLTWVLILRLQFCSHFCAYKQIWNRESFKFLSWENGEWQR